MMDFKLEIWAILLGFKPLCLDLGHLAYIWAILLGFGLFGRIWVSIGPKGDKALRMEQRGDVRTYRQIPPVFYRTSSPSGPLPKKQKQAMLRKIFILTNLAFHHAYKCLVRHAGIDPRSFFLKLWGFWGKCMMF